MSTSGEPTIKPMSDGQEERDVSPRQPEEALSTPKEREDSPSAVHSFGLREVTVEEIESDSRICRTSEVVARAFPALFDDSDNAEKKKKPNCHSMERRVKEDIRLLSAQRQTSTLFDDIQPLPLLLEQALRKPSQPGAFPMPATIPARHGMTCSRDFPEALEGSFATTLTTERSKELLVPIPEVFHASLVLECDCASDDEVDVISGEENQGDIEKCVHVIPLPNTPPPSSDRGKSASKTMVFGCLLCWCVALVALILILVLGHSNKKNDVSSPNTIFKEPKFIVYPPFDSHLQIQSLKAIQEAPDSPQYRANAWMMQDPYLETYPMWRQTQRFSLAAKYFATQGDNWFRNDHWLSYEVSECNWWSRSDQPCNEEGHFVIEDISSNNLNGTIPMEAQLRPHLKYLDNSNNHIFGQMAPLADGANVEVFIMSNNRLAGPIVIQGGFQPEHLRVVKLDGNQLEGDTFMQGIVALLPQLEVLNATGNRFKGTIPYPLGISAKLKYLGLADNDYSGEIPTELGQLSHLQGLDISGNGQLTGHFPTELASLTNLTILDVAGTSITGGIPRGLCSRSDKVTIVANCSHLQCC